MSGSPVPFPPADADARAALPDLSGRTILQVIPELDAGGAERTVLEIAEALREAGARALVISRGGRLAPDLEALGGELIGMDVKSKNPLTLHANARRMAELISDRQIDLVHARSRAPAWSALIAARRTGTAFVTTYHGAYSGRTRLKRHYNSVMARGDRVIANSEWIAEHVRTTHHVEHERLVTIRRGVDLMAFDPGQITAQQIARQREAWGLAATDTRLVCLLPGRLTGWKGQRLAIAALSRLAPDEREGLVLVLMGDAQGREAYVSVLREDIIAANLQASVVIAPHGRDMPGAFAACDIVLAPSTRPEAFGRVAAEAGAMQRPVIASDHGGARETVIDGQTGTRFEPGNPQALAAAIRTLRSIGAAGRAGMGEAGRQHVLQYFSKRGLQAATLLVYSDLVNRSGGTK